MNDVSDTLENITPTHLDKEGRLAMVGVSDKALNKRFAKASAKVRASAATLDALMAGKLKKGETLVAAKIAGITAAKRTGELIPLCHPIALTHVTVDFERQGDGLLEIIASASCVGPTGVEMEAMNAASVAALTIYDMAKSVERGMSIESVVLLEKRGGKSGHWLRKTSR